MAGGRAERQPYGEFLGSPGEKRGGDAMQSRDGEQKRQQAKQIEQLCGRSFHKQGVLIVLPEGLGGGYGRSRLGRDKLVAQRRHIGAWITGHFDRERSIPSGARGHEGDSAR